MIFNDSISKPFQMGSTTATHDGFYALPRSGTPPRSVALLHSPGDALLITTTFLLSRACTNEDHLHEEDAPCESAQGKTVSSE